MATNTWNVYSSWALDIFIEWVAIAQFEKSTFFLQLWKQRTLPKGSNSYKFNKVDAWTLAASGVIAEWVVPTDTGFTMAQVAVTMTQLWAFTKISDILLSDAPTDVLSDAGKEIGRLLWETADTNVQTVLAAWTNVIYSWDATSTATIDATDVIDSMDLAKSFSLLKADAAPLYDGEAYVAVLHPHVIHDLFADTANGSFVELNKYVSPEKAFKWEIGKLFWVRVINSANVTIQADAWAGSVDTYNTFVVWEEAYWVVTAQNMEMSIKMPWSAWTADPLNQIATVWGKLRFWSAILKEESLYRIESASSLWANV